MGKITFATIAMTGLLAFAPFAANAYTGVCASETTAVKDAILGASFLGKNASTDRANLLAKVDAAEAKLSLRKYDDAVDKLLNVTTTAQALADATPKEKLTDASAANIATAVGAAIACIGAL